jgi:hypothetical protein
VIPKGEQLHERWRREYRRSRYAQHLTRPELNKRIRDIFLNMLRVTPDAKIGVFPVNGASAVFWEKWTHVLEEMALRYGPYPSGFDRDILHSEPFPDFASELAGKAARRMSELQLQPGAVFIKLGQQKYMERLISEGALRLQAASYYSRPELNQAVRDDEMTIPLSFVLDREQLKTLVANPQDIPEDAPGQRLDMEFRSTADFWLYCVTRSIEPRHFVDFQAEACVVIKKPAEFAKRLRQGARAATGNTQMTGAKAVYVDPLLPASPKIYVPFSKPFGYSYQDEYRFCWVPNPPIGKLDHADIAIGPLTDIAELIVL